jgi:integrase/recombinase XerD
MREQGRWLLSPWRPPGIDEKMSTRVVADEIINDYLQYQELECGLSANSLAAYKSDIVEFKEFFSLGESYGISHRRVNEYINRLSSLNRKPSSIVRKLSSLKSFYSYLHEKNIVGENPFEYVRTPKISRYHPDYLTVEEIKKILAQPDLKKETGIRDNAMLELLYGTGMRISELINLKMSAVYDEIGFIKIVGKGNKERLVPYGQYARKAVDKYLAEVRELKRALAQSDVLFLSNRNRKFSRAGVWKMIKKYATAAGTKKQVTPHTFRHSFATHMIEGGADLRVVQELLGHASITTTQIYTRVDKDYLLSIHREFHPRERASEQGRDR